jgi:hypothetical protein
VTNFERISAQNMAWLGTDGDSLVVAQTEDYDVD